MRVIVVRKIANLIYQKFHSHKIPISDWVFQNCQYIQQNIEPELTEEELLETIGDNKHKDHDQLVFELKKIISKYCPSNKLELIDDIDQSYIALSKLGVDIDFSIEKELDGYFSKIINWTKMDKGIFYEKFCTLFLQDIGLNAQTTKASNDKGIDIEASYSTKLEEKLSQFVFDDKIYVLAQAKLYSKKVDTSVIRKLVGDSIFLKFNQVDYLNISHNAVHLIVFSHSGFTKDAKEFANQYKIMTIETTQLVSIIAASSKKSEWKCLAFIKKEIADKEEQQKQGMCMK